MKIHLLKKKPLIGLAKTECGLEVKHQRVMEFCKTDLTKDPSKCTCDECLINHEKLEEDV